jgi:hypothetical protein
VAGLLVISPFSDRRPALAVRIGAAVGGQLLAVTAPGNLPLASAALVAIVLGAVLTPRWLPRDGRSGRPVAGMMSEETEGSAR